MGKGSTWVRGDLTGLEFPGDIDALSQGGTAFLTEAFHASGCLGSGNSVSRITRLEECAGGSTGRKCFLSLDYTVPAPGLHPDLFVKFSRDFDDPVRDRSRDQMESEVRFALLSREPGFPIAIPACVFADYHAATGTGLLITQRIAFGQDGIEPHYSKCLDHEMPAPLDHYAQIVRSIARLAGTHRSGRLGPKVERHFPYDAGAHNVVDPIRYDERQLRNRISRFGAFAAEFPRLVPDRLHSPEFLTRLNEEVPLILARQTTIGRYLASQADCIALCDWNANVDNAWFWRDAQGDLHCGLMDWGRVGQKNVAQALWGALSAADLAFLDANFHRLLDLFVAEYQASGGPAVEPAYLKDQLLLYSVTMGLAWLMDAPPVIRAQVPDLADAEGPNDWRFRDREGARTQLHLLTNVLSLWQATDLRAALRRLDLAI